jgi:hypothetical protein
LETQEKRPHTKNLANKTKKNQCIRCQIFWLTYQNNKKKTKKKHQIGIARAKNNQKVKQMQSK